MKTDHKIVNSLGVFFLVFTEYSRIVGISYVGYFQSA